jgi:hypothetical protein
MDPYPEVLKSYRKKANSANFTGKSCRGLESGGTGNDNATPAPGWHGGDGACVMQRVTSCAGHIGCALCGVNSRPDQRQWLLVEHRFNHDFSRKHRIDAVGREHVLAVGNDGISILHDLQPLEMVVVVQTHAGADNVENIDDLEWPIALVRA